MSVLCIENLVKSYAGKKLAADGISFTVEAGEIFGLLGKNGAGKSTTIKCVTGLQGYDSGRIEVCGCDVAADPLGAKRHIGYVPDNHACYEFMTGREYVSFIADVFGRKDYAAEIADLAERFAIALSIDKPISTYSRGMKQKIVLIASLVHRPELWILDEPMVGLDVSMMDLLMRSMKAYAAEGNGVFFSSHNMDTVDKVCDRAAIIVDGRLKEILDLAEFKASGRGPLETYFLEMTGGEER